MRLFSIVKTPRHRRFGYTPVFYDPAMEDLEQRVQEAEARIKAEKEDLPLNYDNHGNRISSAFRRERQKPNIWKGFTSSTAFIRMLIAFMLVGLSYLFLEYGEKIEQMSFTNASPFVVVILGFVFLYGIARFQFMRKR